MAFKKTGAMLPISSIKILNSFDDWTNFKKTASVTVEAEDKTALDKEADFQVVAAIDPEKFIYIHATIMAGIKTEKNGYWVTADTEKFVNENRDAWTCEDLLHDYPTFKTATVFVEHDQNIERAKGRCVDVIARKMADTVLVDVLFSVEKRHENLVANIASNIINAVSMGCSTEKTICTICGKVASDPENYCEHIKKGNKGRTFVCEDGKKRKSAEICKNNRFFDISVVANPAFAGAVFRKILSSVEVSNHLLANILTSKIESIMTDKGETMLKAASKEEDSVNIILSNDGSVMINSGEKTYSIKQALNEQELTNIKNSIQTKKDVPQMENIMSKVFGKEADKHPIEKIQVTDYRVSYDDHSDIPGAVVMGKSKDIPIELVLSDEAIQEKTARIEQFKCLGCGFESDQWQVKAASIDAGNDKSLICPKCGFIKEEMKKTIHQTDKIQLKDLGFNDKDIKELDPEIVETLILKEVTKKEYEKDPNVTMRKGKDQIFIVKADIPVDYDDGTYWLSKHGKSVISKGEKLIFNKTVDDGKINAYITAEGEDVFLPNEKNVSLKKTAEYKYTDKFDLKQDLNIIRRNLLKNDGEIDAMLSLIENMIGALDTTALIIDQNVITTLRMIKNELKKTKVLPKLVDRLTRVMHVVFENE